MHYLLIYHIYFKLKPNIVRVIKSRRLRWAGYVARTEEGRSVFKILTSEPTGRSRHRWENKIKVNFKEMSIDTSEWVDSAQ